MSNVTRVRDLSEEFGVTNKELIIHCKDLGIVAKIASSRLSEEDVATLRAHFKKSAKPKAKKKADAPSKSAPKKRRTSRRRKGDSEEKSEAPAKTEESAKTEEPVKTQRKSRRSGARRRSEGEPEEAKVDAGSEEKAPARRSRSRRRSGRKTEAAQEEAVTQPAVEETKADEKPRRTRRSRSRAAKKEEAVTQPAVEVKQDEPTEEKPRRSRRSRAKTAQEEPPAEEKPRRSRRNRRGSRKTEESAEVAPVASDAEVEEKQVKATPRPEKKSAPAAEQAPKKPAVAKKSSGMSDFVRAFMRNLGSSNTPSEEQEHADPIRFSLPEPAARNVPAALGKRGRLWIEQMFVAMNIEATVTSSYDKDSKQFLFQIEGADASRLLGPTRNTPVVIEAIEKVLFQFLDIEELGYSIRLDVNGFREAATLRFKRLAEHLDRAADSVHAPIVIAGLNDFERRVVHRQLGDIGDVRTESFGHGSFRKLRIEKG